MAWIHLLDETMVRQTPIAVYYANDTIISLERYYDNIFFYSLFHWVYVSLLSDIPTQEPVDYNIASNGM